MIASLQEKEKMLISQIAQREDMRSKLSLTLDSASNAVSEGGGGPKEVECVEYFTERYEQALMKGASLDVKLRACRASLAALEKSNSPPLGPTLPLSEGNEWKGDVFPLLLSLLSSISYLSSPLISSSSDLSSPLLISLLSLISPLLNTLYILSAYLF